MRYNINVIIPVVVVIIIFTKVWTLHKADKHKCHINMRRVIKINGYKSPKING